LDAAARKTRPKLAKKARLKWDEHEKAHFLLYPERGIRLNETASAIVQLCDGTRSVDDIVDELARRFAPEPKERIEEAVLSFLDEMRKRAVVTFFPPPGSTEPM
jgi:coenzyme PQQ biosynthesis protein PqqD